MNPNISFPVWTLVLCTGVSQGPPSGNSRVLQAGVIAAEKLLHTGPAEKPLKAPFVSRKKISRCNSRYEPCRVS